MEFWDNLDVNDAGHLMLGGCDAVKLAEQYGTPLYVMNENKIREVCRSYYKIIKETGINGLVAYASKSFTNKAMVKIIDSEGLGLDVVSGGELYTALSAGIDMKKVYFHGNNKTVAEMEMAVDHQVGRIVPDSIDEINALDEVCAKKGKRICVQVRIKPGIEAHTHDYIKTGTDDSKFGFGIFNGQAIAAIKTILESDNLDFAGLHCHIGSQIFELQPFIETVDVMTDFMLNVRAEFGVEIEEVNFGGGYGIHYVNTDKPLKPWEYVKAIIAALKSDCEKKGLKLPRFVIEPGRSICGEAGTTLYEVGSVKDIPGIVKYANVDGGMFDNPRPALYQAVYTSAVANKMHDKHFDEVAIAGRTCESGDILIKHAWIPKVERGDIVAVFSTGAYNYAMASNYNRLPIPAVVLVQDGKSAMMVKRQTYEDVCGRDEVASWLK